MKNKTIKIVSVFLLLSLVQAFSYANESGKPILNLSFDPNSTSLSMMGFQDSGFGIRGEPLMLRSSVEHPYDVGFGAMIGAGIGAFAVSILTMCIDLWEDSCDGFFNEPAILLGALVGGGIGFALVYEPDKTTVGINVRF